MKYLIANWKMNLNLRDITMWLEEFREALPVIPKDKQVILAPSSPYLAILSENLRNIKGMQVASQDVSVFEKGAHTGEVGAFQLAEFCQYCIVGHSEINDPKETVLKKTQTTLSRGLTPIICFTKNDDAKYFTQNLLAYLENLILVWEDPQNISKNGVYNAKNTKEIEIEVLQIFDIIGPKTTLLYGGSVNKDNVLEISGVKGLSGVLVGNASCNASHFSDIIRNY